MTADRIIVLADDLVSSGADEEVAAALVVDVASGKRVGIVRARHHFLAPLEHDQGDEHASHALRILDLAVQGSGWLDES